MNTGVELVCMEDRTEEAVE